jgi:hypothetical protein
MTLSIGRTVLDDPDVVKVSGDSVEFTVELDASSGAEMRALRQQLANLVGNRDEEVVPVVWTDDDTFDGFYEPMSLSIPSQGLMLENGYLPPMTVGLRRIGGGYANPRFEVSCTNVTRTNAHGLSGSNVIAIPGSGTSLTYDIDEFGGVALTDTRPTADGISMYVLVAGDPNGLSYQFDVQAVDFYNATCSIEIDYSGSGDWYPLVGRQIPRATRWRLSNQIVRLTSGRGAVPASFGVWDGGWESQDIAHLDGFSTVRTLGQYAPGITSAAADRDIAFTVLRNSPEMVSIRYSTFGDHVTWTLARGARHASCNWFVSDSQVGSSPFGIGMTTGTAGTSITGGVVQTTGAAGNQLIFATAEARTADTANTRVRNTTGSTTGTHFVGVRVGPSPGALNDTGAIVAEMMSGLTCRQRVIGR